MNEPEPRSRQTSVTFSSVARKSANSAIPPSCRKVSECGPCSPGRAGQPALVVQDDGQSGHEIARLAGPGDQFVVGERRVGQEDLTVGPVPHPGAGQPALGRPAHPQLTAVEVRRERGVRRGVAPAVGEHPGLAPPEAHRVGLAAAVDLDVEPGGQRVDHARPDPVQPAGGRVRPAAELAAGVQLGEDDLDAGQAGLGLDVHRDAAPVVADLDRAVGVQRHLDPGAVLTQGLVDSIVDDLPEAVHQPPGIGGADVHTGTFADSLEPFEHGEVARGVVGRRPRSARARARADRLDCHTKEATWASRTANATRRGFQELPGLVDCCSNHDDRQESRPH